MSFGVNSQRSGSFPVNITPAQLQQDYGPFAKAFSRLLGGNPGSGNKQLGGIPLGPAGSGLNGPHANPFGAVAPMSAGEQTALGQLNTAAADPNAQNLLDKTMQGGFLPGSPGGNPFLQSAIQFAQAPTLSAMEGQFGQAGQTLRPGGGTGSSAFSYATGQALGNIAAQMSNQDYTTERQLQQNAVGLNQQNMAQMVQNLQANALPRMIQQQGISTGLQLFQQRMSNLLQSLGLMTGQAGMSNIGQVTNSSGSGFNLGIGSP